MKQNKTKGFKKKKRKKEKKKTLEREIENERGPYPTTVTRDLQQRRGKKIQLQKGISKFYLI